MPYPDLLAELRRVRVLLAHLPEPRRTTRSRAPALQPSTSTSSSTPRSSGCDGVCVNEHHQTTYGTIPVAERDGGASWCARTEQVKIALVGNALPLRDHPLRVAEEVAMLDVISGGRIISGFVRGIGVEYLTFGIEPDARRASASTRPTT